jgi:hypothetical protein
LVIKIDLQNAIGAVHAAAGERCKDLITAAAVILPGSRAGLPEFAGMGLMNNR